MRYLKIFAIAAFLTVPAGAGIAGVVEKYPMAGLSAAETSVSAEEKAKAAGPDLAEFNKKLAAAGMAPLTPDKLDSCFEKFSVTTDSGRYLVYQFVDRKSDDGLPHFKLSQARQCVFDGASNVETCSGDKGEREYYLYPKPENRLSAIYLETLTDADAYKLNPSLVEKDVLTFLSCDKFRDVLLPMITTGTVEDKDMPLFLGTLVRRSVYDKSSIEVLKPER